MVEPKIGSVKRLKRILATVSAVVCFTASPVSAQCTNINAPKTVEWVNALIASAIGDDTACRTGAPDRDSFATSTACNIFVGRVMARLYGLTDFKGENNTFLKANEIAALIPTFDKWEEIGNAGDQVALSAAADAANAGNLVLAVWANPTAGQPGHVALIGPGPLTKSPAWGGLKTPVAASFTIDHPEKAFLGQPLACAFGSAKKSATHIWKYTQIVSLH